MLQRPCTDFDPERVESPVERQNRLSALRDACPLAWSDAHGGFWLASRHSDVSIISGDAASYSSAKTFNEDLRQWEGGTVVPALPMRFIPSETDSPEWDRYRGVLNPHFGPKAVESRRARFADFAHALIDGHIETGCIDVVLDVGNPLSAIGTMQLVGFPTDDWWAWAKPFHEVTYHPTGSEALAKAVTDIEWVYVQIRDVIAQRRRQPESDLLSVLMQQELPGGPLSDEELFDLSVQLLGGSIETTTALIANTLMYLDTDKSCRSQLMGNRKLLRPAFDEFLRYFTPVQNSARRTMAPVQVGGIELPAGETILMSWASANQDRSVFPDADKVNIERSPNRHVAMGRGKHFCLGSFQARMIFEVVMNAIFDRLPDLEILVDEAVRYPSIGNVNGWVQMPARFAPGRVRESEDRAEK
ncbi:cytochrome P450 [Sphingobium sp. R-7]|uniref:cytochrome P450 n=1 Tax=Sphingobium sp. R-7 TaxID=3375449 RepID=UPI00398A890A